MLRPGERLRPMLPRRPLEGRDAALEREKLSEENDLWSDVKDFGWLKSTQSPNWTVLPQDQRVEEVREG